MKNETYNIRKRSSFDAPCSMLHAPFRRGFTLLFAVLIGSLLFSVGMAIAHLSIKEVVLSAAGKQSEVAFFAADTGTECALFWDYRMGQTQTVFPKSDAETGLSTITCNGAPVQVTSNKMASAAVSTFTLPFSPQGCAIVSVSKTAAGATTIESRGRNECGNGDNPGRVERALRVKY